MQERRTFNAEEKSKPQRHEDTKKIKPQIIVILSPDDIYRDEPACRQAGNLPARGRKTNRKVAKAQRIKNYVSLRGVMTRGVGTTWQSARAEILAKIYKQKL